MARIRSQHPGQWTDEDFVCMSAFARLLALAIRNEADDNGCFEWKPARIKMRLFPADNVEVGDLLEELVENNQVRSYEVEGKRYGAIRNFRRFQSPRKPNAFCPIPDEISIYVGLTSGSAEPSADEAPSVTDECGTSTAPVKDQSGNCSGEGKKGRREEGSSARAREDTPLSLLRQIKFVTKSDAQTLYGQWCLLHGKDKVDGAISEAFSGNHDLDWLKEKIATPDIELRDPDQIAAETMTASTKRTSTRESRAKAKDLLEKGLIDAATAERNGYKPERASA